jgi:hypothetical protein
MDSTITNEKYFAMKYGTIGLITLEYFECPTISEAMMDKFEGEYNNIGEYVSELYDILGDMPEHIRNSTDFNLIGESMIAKGELYTIGYDDYLIVFRKK